jgi:signal transduction histidine kinase
MAIAEVRQRNLGVSLGIVLLLGASTVMLVLSAQRARRLARQQMEFVAGVSHELRTPVTVICSAADNLAQGMVSNPKQVARYGTVIRDEGRRLSETLEQVLGFAGIQSGKHQFDLQPVDVNEVLERAIFACTSELQSSECQLEKEIAADLPKILADPISLTSCVRNLLSNALKHGSPGSSIGIRAQVSPNGHSPELRISIEDHGVGIEPGELQHIFEPFYRGRRAISDQIHGAGLGLSIVKQVIEAHDGTVEVDSTLGKGSCFTLRIPLTGNA